MERQNCKVYFKELLLAIFAKNIYAEDMVRLLGKQLGDVEACPRPSPTCLRFDALILLLRSFLTTH